jgi:hypothetical protein
MIAYTGTENYKCKEFTYEVGKEYKLTKGQLRYSDTGFVFYKFFVDVDRVYDFYKNDTKVFEVEILGKVDSSGYESITDHIKILREIPRSEWEDVSNGKVKFDKNGNIIYIEHSDKSFSKKQFDKNNNKIYFEDTRIGYWEKKKYDKNNNLIYFENSYGCCIKKRFDKNNNEIYFERPEYWEKRKFDKNNNEIYFECSNGCCIKKKYDKNNNLIYFENSGGYWEKRKYDEKNRQIYYENSEGFLKEIQISK